eukprot:CAMPEP_0117572396 /NCGR_PEP_ID=MMETSP0784-20121206/60330_1 /TAXON_ID=39447 /ORGANISM="" /LENGTH=160 /DNA_ID=CAMNT_0005370755 /DNA_START=184 /DNA_END=666 /DNA_ORIENTATION=-
MRDAHVQLAVVAFPEALWHEDQWKRIIREDPFAVHRTAEGIVDKAGAIVRLWGLRRLPKIVGVWFSGFAQGELHSPGNLRFTDASNRAMEEAAALRKAIEEHRERQRSNTSLRHSFNQLVFTHCKRHVHCGVSVERAGAVLSKPIDCGITDSLNRAVCRS